MKRATIYIKNTTGLGAGGGEYSHGLFGERFVGGYSATVQIAGRPLARTWSLLAETAQAGDFNLKLAHHPTEMGWRVGDAITIASGSRPTSFNNKRSDKATRHKIVSIGPARFVGLPPQQFRLVLPSPHAWS